MACAHGAASWHGNYTRRLQLPTANLMSTVLSRFMCVTLAPVLVPTWVLIVSVEPCMRCILTSHEMLSVRAF